MVEGGNFTVCDNISANQIIGTVPASVPDGQDVTYRLTEDAGGLFEIDEEGRISLASGKRLSFTNINRHVITVEASNTIHTGTHRVNVAINVDTVPLLISTNYVFTYTNDVSVMLNNLGQPVDSFIHSSNLPAGLELVGSSGQLLIQGTPTTVTVGGAVTNVITANNKCGSTTDEVVVAVNPSIFVSGDQSPGIVHVNHTNAGDNDNSLIFKANAIPFANGGTGAYNDPIVIGVADGATNISFVLDFSNVQVPVDNFDSLTNPEQQAFHISLLNVPDESVYTSFTAEIIRPIIQIFATIFSGVKWDSSNVIELRAFFSPGDSIRRTGSAVNSPGVHETIQCRELVDISTSIQIFTSTVRFTVNITPP